MALPSGEWGFGLKICGFCGRPQARVRFPLRFAAGKARLCAAHVAAKDLPPGALPLDPGRGTVSSCRLNRRGQALPRPPLVSAASSGSLCPFGAIGPLGRRFPSEPCTPPQRPAHCAGLFSYTEALSPPPGRMVPHGAGVSGEGILPRPGSGAAPRGGLCHRRSPLPSPGPHGDRASPLVGSAGGPCPPAGVRGSAPGGPRGSLFGFWSVAPCICGRFMLSCL